jgi:hypothetical protein
MDSDNLIGAGNQQERPCTAEWIAGFTDGEGCFSISVVKNEGCRLGWQVQHEFAITQAFGSVEALELVREHFGCGRIIVQRRRDDHREPLARYSIKRRADLNGIVIPFFEAHPLATAKRRDFERSSGRWRSSTVAGTSKSTRISHGVHCSDLPGILRGHHEMKIWSPHGDMRFPGKRVACESTHQRRSRFDKAKQ